MLKVATAPIPCARIVATTFRSCVDLLLSVANNIMGKTLCAFGDAAATPVLTTVQLFREEYEAHVREGRCTVPAEWRAQTRAMAAH